MASSDCDTCTEKGIGYDRAIEVLETHHAHLRRSAADLHLMNGIRSAIEELRKER